MGDLTLWYLEVIITHCLHSVSSVMIVLLCLADKDRLDLDEDSLGVCSMRNGSGIGSSNNSNGCGVGNGGGNFNQFLGPLLWDRTLPADGGLFQLQYMDLEEFLTENGMGSMHNNNSSSSAQIPSQSSQSAVPNQSSQCLPPSSPPGSTSSSPSSSSSPSLLGLEVAQSQNLGGGSDCLHGEFAEIPNNMIQETPRVRKPCDGFHNIQHHDLLHHRRGCK